MVAEKRLIDSNDVYSLFDKSGFARLHVSDIDTIPRVDAVEVERGWWIELPGMEPDYKCSECGRSYAWWEPSEAHYCPNCGAKMDLEEGCRWHMNTTSSGVMWFYAGAVSPTATTSRSRFGR